MTTTNLFIWSIDSEGASYPSEFTSMGRDFISDAMSEIVNNNLPFDITPEIAESFLYLYEEGCMIHSFSKDDSVNYVIGKILEDFYKDIMESTKSAITSIDHDVADYLETETFSEDASCNL